MARFGKWIVRLILLLQPVLFHWRTLVFPTTHIPYDIEGYHYPLIAYMAACIRHGWAPFWDPNTYAGMPLSADLQSQMWYPPTWLAIMAGNLNGGRDLFYVVEWLVPLHMMLAGLCSYALFRRMGLSRPAALLGADVCQLGGFYASQACHLGAICSASWLPLGAIAVWELRLGFQRRWFAILAMAVSASIMAGFAATTIVVCGALVLLSLGLAVDRQAHWQTVPTLLAAVCLAATGAAIVLIPLLELTPLSIASLRWQLHNPMGAPLESLVSLVRPDYYHIFEPDSGYKLPYNYTFLYVYCGLVPLALALAAPFVRRARLFLVLAVLSAFWMLGEFTPVYPAVFGLMPQLVRSASYAWLAMAAFCFFVGASAAMVLDNCTRRLPPVMPWLLVLVTSADLILTGGNRPMNAATGGPDAITATEFAYQKDAAALGRLHQLVASSETPPLRTDYADVWAPGILAGGMLGMPTSDGHVPFMLSRMMLFRRIFTGGKPEDRNRPVVKFDSPLLRFLNVGYVGTILGVPAPGLAMVGEYAGLAMYQIPKPLPRFFLVSKVSRSASEAETFQLLAKPDFDPATNAIVEGPIHAVSGLGTGTVKVRSYIPDEVRLRVDTAKPGFLVSSEPLYPGWTATVNGSPAPIHMTNGVFRGLEVPAGASEVVMAYQPIGLWIWAPVSGLIWICLLFSAAL